MILRIQKLYSLIKISQAKLLVVLFVLMLGGSSAWAQPANDEPCNAISLPVAASCNYQQFTNLNATATPGVTPPGCANYQGGDVWFTVTIPSTGGVLIDALQGSITDGGMAVYTGTCTALTLVSCDDDASANGLMPFISTGGLVPGSTLFIRFWEYGGNANGTFSLCVTAAPPPPTNIAPCTATLLPVGFSCAYTTFTNASAPGFTGAPAPGCANYQGGDVWFKAVVPCSGSIDIDSKEGSLTDGGMALYTAANCNGPLTLVACDDNSSANGLMPYLSVNNLVPFDTVYIRFWEFGNNNNGTFGLCATVPSLIGSGPSGSCNTATAFCTGGGPVSYPSVTGQPNSNGSGIYGCLFTIPNPAYYFLQIQNSGYYQTVISQQNTAGAPIDVDFVLWGPFASANSCTQISAANIIDCSYSASATETIDIPNAVAGEFYILLVTNFNGAPGTITYTQTANSTATTNCGISCTLNATNSGPVCAGSTVNLFASSVPNATYSWLGPNCFTSTQQNPTGVTPPATPGTYVYYVTASGPNGQNCSDTTRVTVIAAPNVGNDTTIRSCSGTNLNLTTLFNTTGFNVTYTQNGNTVTTPAAVTNSGVYTIVAANSGSCADTIKVNFISDTVRVTASSTNENCTTPGVITATATSGIAPFQYAISTNPGVFQTSPTFNAPAGSYTITARDSLGCTASTQVTVTKTNNLTLTGTSAYTICNGQSVPLAIQSNGSNFSWSPTTGLSNPNIINPVANPSVTTNYTVTATLGTCTQTFNVLVTVGTGVTVNAGPDVTILSGETGMLSGNVTGGTINSILWTPSTNLSSTSILNPVVTAPVGSLGSTITYTLSATNTDGCIGSDQAVVTIIPYCVNVRNAFTPNGDGQNDLWQVYDDFGCLKNVTVNVFNRYGSKVYEDKNYRNSWRGTYKNQAIPDGTYFAVVEFTLITGRTFQVRSDVTVIR